MCATDALVEFCIAQHDVFAREAWLEFGKAEGNAIAFAAKYLSMTSWYGHEDELEEIAAKVYSGGESSVGLHRELRTMGFDLTSFSTQVRSGISGCHSERTGHGDMPMAAQGMAKETSIVPARPGH